MGDAGRGCEWAKLVVGYGQGSPFGKLLDCALLNSGENGKIQGFVADDTQDCDVGNAEDMCLDSLGEHILQVGPSRQLEDRMNMRWLICISPWRKCWRCR